MGILSKISKSINARKHYTLNVMQEDKDNYTDKGESIVGGFFDTGYCQHLISLIPCTLPKIKNNVIIENIPIGIFKEMYTGYNVIENTNFLKAEFPDGTHDDDISYYYEYTTKCHIPKFFAKNIFVPSYISGVTLYIKYKSDIICLPDILNEHFLEENNEIYDYDREFWELIIVPLISIFQCCYQEAVDSFAPGIVNTFEKLKETAFHASIMQRKEMVNQTSLFLKNLCYQLLDMGAYKQYDINQAVQEAIDKKNLDDKIKELGIHPDKINEEEVNSFLSYIQNRQELLNEFNNIKK